MSRASQSHARPGLSRGFTLVELMVTLVVAGIFLRVAVPSMSKLISNNRLSIQTNEFVTGLNLARSEAIRRSQGVSLRSNAGTGEFSAGWKVFNDSSLSGAAPSSSDVIRDVSGNAGKSSVKRVTCTGSGTSPTCTVSTDSWAPYIAFNSRGGNNAGTASFFRICDTGDASIKGRVVQVSTVGKVSLFSTSATCPSS